VNKNEIELTKEWNELDDKVQELVDQREDVQTQIEQLRDRIHEIKAILQKRDALIAAIGKAAEGVFITNEEKELLRLHYEELAKEYEEEPSE
jgi:uncharacterized coiled-coil DUF342 family protein